MEAKKQILERLARADAASGRELRELLGISRQALSVHLRGLIDSGDVIKSGSTRAARYSLASRAPAPLVVTRECPLTDLDEGEVFEAIAINLGLHRQLRPPIEAIVRYAFTEILNNAIDHSEADRCKMTFRLDAGKASFEIRDPGIGLFDSIASKLGLPDEQTAMLELVKGRTTTAAERHSGEGLFFTSKVADRFLLRSHKIQIEWVRSRDDVFVSSQRFLHGTLVQFAVSRSARHRLEKIFHEFAPEDYDFRFQRTRIQVKLLQSDYVSRSEAKRLLANLDKFSEVILDFKDVRSIGQGFADEIFRVFLQRHPDMKIAAENANPVVAAMLRHVGG